MNHTKKVGKKFRVDVIVYADGENQDRVAEQVMFLLEHKLPEYDFDFNSCMEIL